MHNNCMRGLLVLTSSACKKSHKISGTSCAVGQLAHMEKKHSTALNYKLSNDYNESLSLLSKYLQYQSLRGIGISGLK